MREITSNFTVSIHYDSRLYRQDIAGSIAHVKMLSKQEIITSEESVEIIKGLMAIRKEIEEGTFQWRPELEDIHMNIERRLFDRIGDLAGKLHTARSRNDQVALDTRMWTKEAIVHIFGSIRDLREALLARAEANARVVMPGYTHLQKAQPVLFAHHLLAYFEMLGRDRQRFLQAYDRADVMPLGSGALAGVPYPLDREYVAKELGFSNISSNSMDAVSDRDFILDVISAASICMMHLSRLAEELVVWSTDEFGFVRLSSEYTTGSSMMPQKRNPDFAELSRGRTGRVYGHLMSMLTVLKGLPLTYNRDLQEDKEALFDTVDTLGPVLEVMTGMVSTMQVNEARMEQAVNSNYLLATDIADYLVAKGLPFREAYGIVSSMSSFAYTENKRFNELNLDTYREFSPLFDESVYQITAERSVAARNVQGGTSFKRVEEAIAAARSELEREVTPSATPI